MVQVLRSKSRHGMRLLTFLLVALSSLSVSAFTLPALGVGSFHARRAIPLSSNMGSNYSAKTIGVRPLYSLKTESEPSETKKHTPSRQVVTDDVVMWLKEHGSAVALSTAVISASALALPAISNAAPAVAELSGSGGLSSSASVFLEWLSGTGFYQAFSLVFLSEIGDKTFFIAGLLSMKTSRFISFVGSIGALAAMTVLSCLIGQVFHAVPSGLTQGLPLDDIAAVLAFAFFGVKTLMEALESDPSEGNSGMDEEFADAEEAVESSDAIKQATTLAQITSTFGLVFAAEFGDRSFLSTIALSAAQNPFSVAVGAIAAHAVATGIAVLGGGVLAKYISERVIGIISGTLFLVFALTTALGIF